MNGDGTTHLADMTDVDVAELDCFTIAENRAH
jgi:hypothetical protein